MPTSFQWGGSTITARGDLTIGDEDVITAIMYKLPDDTARTPAYKFAEFQVAAVVDNADQFPVPLVRETDEPDVVRASYDAWRKLPRKFVGQWRSALSDAEATPNG